METDAPLGRKTTRDYFTGSSLVHHVTDPAGTITTFSYDAEGRLASQSAAPGAAPGIAARTITRSFTYVPFGMQSATVTSSPADAVSHATAMPSCGGTAWYIVGS